MATPFVARGRRRRVFVIGNAGNNRLGLTRIDQSYWEDSPIIEYAPGHHPNDPQPVTPETKPLAIPPPELTPQPSPVPAATATPATTEAQPIIPGVFQVATSWVMDHKLLAALLALAALYFGSKILRGK